MDRRFSMNLHDFHAVMVLADELNYHRAARKLGMTESGLSRLIVKVERKVDASLFIRSHSNHSSVALTDPCRRLVEKARLVVAHSESAVRSVREAVRGMEHTIVIGRTPYTNPALLSILRSIELPLYPNLRLQFETAFACELPAHVRSTEFDAALVTHPQPDTLLSSVRLLCAPFAAVVSADHDHDLEDAATLSDFARVPWILFERRIHPVLYDKFLDRARELGVRPDRIYHVVNAGEGCDLALKEEGVAFLTHHGAARVITKAHASFPLAEPGIYCDTHLVVLADNRSKVLSELVRAFVKKLKQNGLYQPELNLGRSTAASSASNPSQDAST
jgi:DNA-binding transcriptional LysR family regulator